MTALKKEYDIVESLLDDETKTLVNGSEKKLENHITKTIEKFKEMKIPDYLVNRPKNLVQKMMEAKDQSDDMEPNVFVIEETIRQKYVDKFKELK
jgi:flagellar biosynthesis component FlhA